MIQTPEELTEDWKEGKLESLNNLIEFIKSTDNHQALSDNYLKENNCATRNEYNPAQEWGYGIVWVIADYVLPYLEQIKAMQEQLNKEGIWYTKISYKKLEKENNDLRGLLKKCDGCVRCLWAFGAVDCDGNNINDLITKIEEVLK